MAQAHVNTRFTAQDRYSRTIGRMSANTNRFASRAQLHVARVDMAFNRLTSPLRRVSGMLGNLGLFVGGAAFVGAVGGAVRIFADFEQANSNLAAIMSGTTRPELQALQEDAKRLGSTTSKTATQVVGLQEAYARLGFSQQQILNMTEATVQGSDALGGELDKTAELTGAMVRTFDRFSSTDAPEILDQMTLATQKSALNFEKLSTGLPIVAGAANAAGVPFTTLMALMGKLSDAGIDVSSSATSLRNIFIDSEKKGHSYSQILDNIQKNQHKLTAANDEFGKRAAVSASVLSNNIESTEQLDQTLRKAAKGQELSGAAALAAAQRLDNLKGDVTLLSSAYEGFILSVEDGQGAVGGFLRTTIQATTEILNLWSGTAKATEQLTEKEQRIRDVANRMQFWIKIIGGAIGIMTTMKVIISITKMGLAVYNAVIAINTFLQKRNLISMLALKAGYLAATIAVNAMTAANWLLNASNPVGWIMILIGVVALMVTQWDKWGAALTVFLGPLGYVVSLIATFVKHWDTIKSAFQDGGIMQGMKAIGKVMIEALLMPLQQLLELASKIPGVGNIAASGAQKIAGMRQNLGLESVGNIKDEFKQVDNKQAREERFFERQETLQKQRIDLMIEDKTGTAKVNNQSGANIEFAPTVGGM